MPKKPSISIFLINENQATRADLTASRVVTSIESLATNNANDWRAAVKALVQSAQPLGRRVVVLSNAVNSHLISIPRASVAQMTPDEIDNALRFEVETLSGIEIEDIALVRVEAYDDLSGDVRFWVNVVRESEFNEIADWVKNQGVRTVELAHPAGFGSNSQSSENFRELWGNTAFQFDAKSRKLVEFHRVVASVASDEPTSKFDLGWPNEILGIDGTAIAHDLSTLAELEGWFQSIASQIFENHSGVPILRRKRAASSFDWRPLLATGLICAVLVGCIFHRNWLQTQIANTIQLTEEVALPNARKKRDDTETLKLLEQLKEQESEALRINNELKRVKFFYDNQRDRLAHLLKMVGELRTTEMVVQEFTNDPNGMVVAGITLNGEAAPLLANRLKLLAAPLGWKVSGANQKGQQKMVSGGPWTFQILLEDVGPFESAPPDVVPNTTSPTIRGKF